MRNLASTVRNFPAAQISKVIDEENGRIMGYKVEIFRQNSIPVVGGYYQNLEEVFTKAFHNSLTLTTRSYITIALAVDGPVTIGLGNDMKKFESEPAENAENA